jgi:hypothetical protein
VFSVADDRVRVPDRRTTPALLALCAFVVLACLPVALVWSLVVGDTTSSTPLRQTLAPQPDEASAVTEPSWRTVANRHAGFDVDAPRWRALGQETSLHRRSDGLSREVFQFGNATDFRRYAGLVVDRGEIDPVSPLAGLTAMLVDLGVPVTRLGANPLPLATKFGPMATADMTIDTEENGKACLAFALREAEAGIAIAGWVCNGGPELVSRQEASCFVDRLFSVGVRDPHVAQIFARAELARQPCAVPTGALPAPVSERNGQPSPLRLRRL